MLRTLELPRQVIPQNVEPMQVDGDRAPGYLANDEVDGRPGPEEIILVNRVPFELETYISNYSGLAMLYRLMFIAERCPPLRVTAFRMALDHVLGTLNVAKYTEIHRKLVEAVAEASANGMPDIAEIGEVPPLDNAWMESRLKQIALKAEKLDTELKNYKANSIKESIRRGTDDLGEHYLDCGDLTNALRCFARARDYCTSTKHVVDYCLNVTRVSVYLQNWHNVECYALKADPDVFQRSCNGSSGSSSRDAINSVVLNKLRCCNGLALLATRKYKKAALQFLQANAYCCDFPDLISARDVATYAGLCALASFDRAELARNVIEHQNFKQLLELDPQLRDLIQHFYESRYGQCLTLLDQLRDALLLDMYLSPHVSSLYGQIRNRAWIQYFSPYISADMNRMAKAFHTTVQQVEEEMMQLVLDNQIQARIDSHNKIVYAKDVDQRSSTFEKCIQTGNEFERKTKALLLRAALIKNRIFVRSPPCGTNSGASQVTNGDGEKAS